MAENESGRFNMDNNKEVFLAIAARLGHAKARELLQYLKGDRLIGPNWP